MPSLPWVVVDVCRPAPDRLPDQLVESALRLGRLQRRGFFVEVGQRLRLQRKAGSYVGIDLVAFLAAGWRRWPAGCVGRAPPRSPVSPAACRTTPTPTGTTAGLNTTWTSARCTSAACTPSARWRPRWRPSTGRHAFAGCRAGGGTPTAPSCDARPTRGRMPRRSASAPPNNPRGTAGAGRSGPPPIHSPRAPASGAGAAGRTTAGPGSPGPDSQTAAQDPDITRQKTVPDRVGPVAGPGGGWPAGVVRGCSRIPPGDTAISTDRGLRPRGPPPAAQPPLRWRPGRGPSRGTPTSGSCLPRRATWSPAASCRRSRRRRW